MFSIKEKVVYPGYGVARINCIVEKSIGGCITKFYELTILSTDMTVLVPINSISEIGIRSISTEAHIENLFKLLGKPPTKKSAESLAPNWSKKNKAYQCAIRSGELEEVYRIYRELTYIAAQKELFIR